MVMTVICSVNGVIPGETLWISVHLSAGYVTDVSRVSPPLHTIVLPRDFWRAIKPFGAVNYSAGCCEGSML